MAKQIVRETHNTWVKHFVICYRVAENVEIKIEDHDIVCPN